MRPEPDFVVRGEPDDVMRDCERILAALNLVAPEGCEPTIGVIIWSMQMTLAPVLPIAGKELIAFLRLMADTMDATLHGRPNAERLQRKMWAAHKRLVARFEREIASEAETGAPVQ